MTDRETLENALSLAQKRAAGGGREPIHSVIAQIEYVVANLAGENDGSRLGEIVVGLQAAREYDQDEPFADLLYKTQDISRRLREGRGA